MRKMQQSPYPHLWLITHVPPCSSLFLIIFYDLHPNIVSCYQLQTWLLQNVSISAGCRHADSFLLKIIKFYGDVCIFFINFNSLLCKYLHKNCGHILRTIANHCNSTHLLASVWDMGKFKVVDCSVMYHHVTLQSLFLGCLNLLKPV